MDKDINEQLLKTSEDGNVNEVMELLKIGADTETIDVHGWTPLILASHNGHAEVIKLLLDCNANIEAKTYNGNTSLIFSAHCDSTRITKLLLENCADITVTNIFGKTCLSAYRSSTSTWDEEYIQELIINKQPHNIKFFDDRIGILPSLREKYKDIIELSLMGLF